MNNNKKYIILCSFASIITLIISILSMENIYLMILNLILSLIFFIRCKKYKLKKYSITLPIIYIVFLVSMITLSLIINNYVLIEYIHIRYYLGLVLLGNIMLNTYSILCLEKK